MSHSEIFKLSRTAASFESLVVKDIGIDGYMKQYYGSTGGYRSDCPGGPKSPAPSARQQESPLPKQIVHKSSVARLQWTVRSANPELPPLSLAGDPFPCWLLIGISRSMISIALPYESPNRKGVSR